MTSLGYRSDGLGRLTWVRIVRGAANCNLNCKPHFADFSRSALSYLREKAKAGWDSGDSL